jgi:toxin ParE1/3/4
LKLRFSRRAWDDLRDIGDWIAQGSPRRATRVVDRLIGRSHLLTEHPQAGPLRPEYGEGVRCLSERPYLILYRIEGSAAVIERVIHGARAPDGLA